MPREFARLRDQAPAALRGRTAYTTPLNATNRLLVGPFASEREAQAFVNRLGESDVRAFAWTSAAGQEIDRLQTADGARPGRRAPGRSPRGDEPPMTLAPLATDPARSEDVFTRKTIALVRGPRDAFQRDRDRIIHSIPFRRLRHKTQVFVAPDADHVRVRLTHSLEVAQIARTLARALGLNEDLTEALAWPTTSAIRPSAMPARTCCRRRWPRRAASTTTPTRSAC